MPYEVKELTGSLFTNEDKEHDKQPDFTGNVKIKGKLWRLAAWNSTSQGGREYLSMKVSDPEEWKREHGAVTPTAGHSQAMSDERFQQERERRRRETKPLVDINDDDIPF